MKVLFGILVAVLLPVFCAIDIYQAGQTIGLALGVGLSVFFSALALGAVASLRDDLKRFSELLQQMNRR